MRESAVKYGITAATVILIATGCARQATPTGGPKDATPPVVVESDPPSGTIRFKSKNISVTFDEFVILDKLNEKFMISPPVGIKPKINIRGKSLNIEFMDKLKDSTTYTLYFQDIIRDLNEGNPIPNYQYVFSTGNVLDSLSVTGNVLLADNLESGKNILVLLYTNLADTAPRKLIPDYITIADINGYFRINNVKGGNYRLYALVDNNNNKRYDLSDETFAFLDSVIDVNPVKNFIPEKPTGKDSIDLKMAGKNVKNKLFSKSKTKSQEKDTTSTKKKEKVVPFINGEHKLYLFTTPKKAHYLISSERKMPYQFRYFLSLPPDTMKFGFKMADPGNYNFFTEKNIRGDTITVWLRDSALYSQQLIKAVVTFPYTDSTGILIYRSDSIPMRYQTGRQGKGKQAISSFKITDNIPVAGIKPGQQIFFYSTLPLLAPDTSKIKLFNLKGKDKIPLQAAFSTDSSNSRKLLLNSPLKEGERYLLITDKGSFRSIYGDKSDSTGIGILVRPQNSFGHVTMDVRNGNGPLIIQLLNSRENVLEERRVVNKGNADFPLLEKGMYRVRVIYDLNGDGKWTTGNYDKKLQPEPVSYYPREIEVKADWELIEEWDISSANAKEQVMKEKKETDR